MSDRCEPPEHLRGVDGLFWLQLGDKQFPAKWTAREHWWDAIHVSGHSHVMSDMGYRCGASVATPAKVETLRAERDSMQATCRKLLEQVQERDAELATLRARAERLEEVLRALSLAAANYQGAIYTATSKPYPWPALDIAQDTARAALEDRT